MKAIVLAAGYATRMHPLTLTQPKPLLPLGGRTILDYIIENLNTLPLDEIIIVSNHKFYAHFKSWLRYAKSQIKVSILNDGSITESDRLGAIGDIDFTLRVKKIQEDIVIIAGDNFITYPLIEQYEFFKQKASDTICAHRISDRKELTRFAVAVLDDDNKVLSLVEKPEEPPSDVAIFATYFYKKETVALFSKYLSEGNTPDAPGYFVQWLHKKKDVYAYIVNGECYDIGTIEAYEAMKAKLNKA